MKIAVRGGHTETSPGASLIIDELKMDRLVKDSVISYLRKGGATVYDVTPSSSLAYPQELNYGINKANELDVDLFVSIHFNNCYDFKVTESIGTEVWVYKDKFDEAKRVVNNLSALGFKNRGVKSMIGSDRVLGELKRTNMKAMIVEVCFVESIADYNIFKNVGIEKIGKNIADGILNKKIEITTTIPSLDNDYKLVRQNGTCTVNVNELMIREKPSRNSNSVGSYKKGEKVIYDYYCDNEGYRWISWVGRSGKRRFMAVRVLKTNERYGICV